MKIADDIVRVLTVLLVCKRIENTEVCKESNATVKLVKTCPGTLQDWRNAATLKNCGSIQNSCSSFQYHCVMNTWRNETVEVCAPQYSIIGGNCAEYNFGGFRIQRNGNVKCTGCPMTYSSTESYKFQECYNTSQFASENSPTTAPIRQGATSAMLTKERTIRLSLSSSGTIQRPSQLKQSNYSLSNFDEKLIAVICAVVVAVMILVIILIFTRTSWSKHFSLQLKGLCNDKRQTHNTSQESKSSCSNSDYESLLTKTPRAVLSKHSEASTSTLEKSIHSIV
uniref:Uncharacterized protein LOC111101049 n=1 Tax=Crassostrea virginica TaxID=6565 RepID=A0A8B8AC11_CRAVI|nr:uncharacterized protein LOC111101049 [Crassostrea virginica]XP_022289015.1 uncharacterized protein LOC111101049 [Crassostrea virginica]XP_022289016.1 uncharacterized protein LOC111101049 [Crassostrea virginica]XP_022289017.1 uncharacterized protein LOC111101049 [Crassostrea virginica]